MGKMVRNVVTVKDEGKGADMKRYVSLSSVVINCILMTSWSRLYWTKSTSHRYLSRPNRHYGNTTTLFGYTPCRLL